MNQWFEETLIAIEPTERSSNPLSNFELLELPAHSTAPQAVRKNGRKMTFTTRYQAECWIERNFSISAITVQPEDLTEEIERRKAILEREEREAASYYPPREVTEIERLSWGL